MGREFRITTARLAVRLLARRDITEFTRYRNIDAVARFQEWPVPYTRDHAHELIDELERLRRPTAGEWVQLAIEHAGELVGDLAVWLDPGADLAMVGYTLAPEQQGHGYASEALAGLVDWLFRRQRVHRVAATLDPRNLASARVLEQCGFEYVGTARSAAYARGEWTDDARFSLLRDDWDAWRSRPTGEPTEITLDEITANDVRAVGDIEVAFSQRGLVAPVLVSIAEAAHPPVVGGERVEPWVRAVRADGALAGFVMVAEPFPGSPHPYLWRLTIDRRHQRRGIGRRVVLEVARRHRDAGATHLAVDYVPDVPGSAEGFYQALGFEPTGEVHDGEHRAVLDLAHVPADR